MKKGFLLLKNESPFSLLLLLLTAYCLLFTRLCLAQDYEVPTSVVDEGGLVGESSEYGVQGSAGQGVTGEGSGTGYQLGSGYQYTTNTIPTATNLSPDAKTVEDTTPTLYWVYSDKDGDSQKRYQVQVAPRGAGFGAVGGVDSGVVTSSKSSFASSLLSEGDYKWRVRVHDGWDWSGWTAEVAFTVSLKKEKPIIIVIPEPPPDIGELIPVPGVPGEEEVVRPPGYTTPEPEFEIVAPEGESIILIIYELRKVPEGTIIFMRRVSDILVERLRITVPEEYLPLADGFYSFYIVRIEYGSGKFAEDVFHEFYIDTTPPVLVCIPPEGAILGIDEERPLISSVVEDATGGIDPNSIRMAITDSFHVLGASVNEFLKYVKEKRAPYTGTRGEISYDNYSAATPFAGGLADGKVTIALNVSDWVGNESTHSWAFTVDTEPPKGGIVINQRFADDEEGAPRTPSCQVTLSLAADGTGTRAAKLILSNREDFAGAIEERIPSLEEKVSFQRSWTLSPIRGVRRVFVRFKDEAENRSITYSDAIFLDILPPMVFITSRPPLVIKAESAEAKFTFEASEDGCRFKYRFDDEEWPAEWSDPPARKGETPPRTFPQGSHSFEVVAGKDIDEDGTIESGEESIPASANWIINPAGIGPALGPPEKPIKYWREE